MLLEMYWYLGNQLLRDADWAGMAHSNEIRTPLVDYTLFETLLPLYSSPTPPAKFDFAASPLKPIPDAVLNRRKTGFAVRVQDWIAGDVHNPFRDPGLRGYAHYLLAT
jgi:asparagine synthase (glutamine-hydrolysing)